MVQIARECSNCVHGEEHPYANEYLFCKVHEARVAMEDFCDKFEAKFQVTEVVEQVQYESEVPDMYTGDPNWNETEEHDEEYKN